MPSQRTDNDSFPGEKSREFIEERAGQKTKLENPRLRNNRWNKSGIDNEK